MAFNTITTKARLQPMAIIISPYSSLFIIPDVPLVQYAPPETLNLSKTAFNTEAPPIKRTWQ